MTIASGEHTARIPAQRTGLHERLEAGRAVKAYADAGRQGNVAALLEPYLARTVAGMCRCGKPAIHVALPEDDSEWACAVPR